MHRVLLCCCILIVLMSSQFVSLSQDETADNQPDEIATMEAVISSAISASNQAEILYSDMSNVALSIQEMQGDIAYDATNIQDRAQLAFDLLTLFLALGGFAVGIAILIVVLGFRRLSGARAEFTKARENLIADFERQFSDLQKKYDSLLESQNSQYNQQRNELKTLQVELEQSAEERGRRTERALLAQAYIPLASTQYRALDYSGAISSYQTALELDPINPVVHYRVGYVYTQQGDLEKARYHYEKAMSLAENFAPAMAGLGYVTRREAEKVEEGIQRREKMNEAEMLLLKALKLAPKLVDDDGESWWGILGGLYRRRGQIDEAIYAYQQATFVTPQSSYGYISLAFLFLKQGNRTDMLRTYAQAEKLAEAETKADVYNFWGYADLVVTRYALGKAIEAEPVLERAITIAPLESPYMLEGLQGTLEDLRTVLEANKQPAIDKAIQRLKDAQVARNNF